MPATPRKGSRLMKSHSLRISITIEKQALHQGTLSEIEVATGNKTFTKVLLQQRRLEEDARLFLRKNFSERKMYKTMLHLQMRPMYQSIHGVVAKHIISMNTQAIALLFSRI